MGKLRFLSARAALGAFATTIALTSTACGSLLGITDGLLVSDDASAGDDSNLPGDVSSDGGAEGSQDVDTQDVHVAEDANNEDAASDGNGGTDAVDDRIVEAGDGGDASDAGDGAPAEGGDACVDPNYCTSHCASGVDTCGVARSCTDNCPSSLTCDMSSGQCVCVSDLSWCNGRCGTIQDNCGMALPCPACDGGLACTSNTCGCVPLPNPCGNQQCGQVLDSCGHPVSCGNNGICAGGGICDVNSGTCCTPNQNPCGGRCNVSVDNGCSQMISCSPSCPSPEVCDPTGNCCSPSACGTACGTISNGCGGTMFCGCASGQVCDPGGQCCIPNGMPCSDTCVDNCGQPVPCCPEGGPPDSGPPDGGPPDGGSCSQLGGPCPWGQGCCPGFVCTATQICAPSCSPLGGGCTSLANCCYGAMSCGGVVLEAGGGTMSPMPMGAMPGMCQ